MFCPVFKKVKKFKKKKTTFIAIFRLVFNLKTSHYSLAKTDM